METRRADDTDRNDIFFSGLADEAHSYPKMTAQGWRRDPLARTVEPRKGF
jgi:hypothetical protein